MIMSASSSALHVRRSNAGIRASLLEQTAAIEDTLQ